MKRWLKRGALALAVLLAVAFVAAGLGWGWLHSTSGEALVREQALDAVKKALAGKVEVKGLSLDGSRLVLTDLKLFTPEGQLVAEVERVEVEVALGSLAFGELRLHQVSVSKPRLYLEQTEQGLNLSRAIAAKLAAPATAKPGASGGALNLFIDALELHHGHLSFSSPAQKVVLDEVGAKGFLVLRTAPLEVTSTLMVTATGKEPLASPLSLDVAVNSMRPDSLKVEASLSAGDTHGKAIAHWPEQRLKLDEVVVTPPVVRAFVPSWPLSVPVSLDGNVSATEGALEVRAASGLLKLGGKWELAGPSVEALTLEASGLNLAELVDGGQPSQLTVSLHGALPVARVEALAGALEGHAAWKSLQGDPLASLDLALHAKDGRLTVEKLAAVLPGLEASVQGDGDLKTVALAGKVEARDLALLARAVQGLTGGTAPALTGRGHLAVTATGPTLHPAVKLSGDFPTLKLPGLRAQQVHLDAQVPDVLKPFETDGAFSAQRLQFGERVFEAVHAQVLTMGREVEAQVSAQGMGDLSLKLFGVLDRDSQGLAVQALSLSGSGTEWNLEGQSHLAWSEEGAAVEHLTLRAGEQRLSFDGRTVGKRLDAHLEAQALKLEKLPRMAVPESLGLAGVVDAKLTATGRVARPDVDLTLSWKDGAVAGVSGIGLELIARVKDDEATGKLEAQTDFARATGDFALPLDALAAERAEPLRIHFEAHDVSVAKALLAARAEATVDAVLSASVDVTGTAADPLLKVQVMTPRALVERLKPDGTTQQLVLADVHLEGGTDAQPTAAAGGRGEALRGLGLTASLGLLGGTVRASFSLPLSLHQLRKHLPSSAEVRALDHASTLEVRGIDLAQLKNYGVEVEHLGGSAALAATAHGPLSAPELDATLTVAGASAATLEGLEAKVHLAADASHTALDADASLGGKPLLTLKAGIEVPPLGLRDDGAGDRAVALVFDVPSLDLARVLPRHDEPGTHPGGVLGLRGTFGGTLNAPTIDVSGSVQTLSFGKAPLGAARLTWKGEAARQHLALVLGGLGRDDLKVKGEVGVDLSLRAFRRGLAVDDSPLHLTLESRELDLAFLSGLSETVRVVGGRLTLQGAVDGTVGAPKFRGEGAWTQGRLSLAGFGEYRDIELNAKASNDEMSIDRLVAHSGGGSATLTARAVRSVKDTWALTFSGDAKRFPLINDGQLVATTTVALSGEGDVLPNQVSIDRLSLARVVVELPDVKGREVQSLERAADIVVLRGGKRPPLPASARAASSEAAERAPKRKTFRAVIDAPRDVWVKSSDLNLELGLSEGFTVDVGEAALISGSARILRGKVEVIGRKFEVQSGSEVRFSGPAAEPYINLVAVHVNDREKVTVTMTVSGKGKQVVLKPTSEPPMSESDIYTLLATGRTSLHRGSGSSMTADQAVSVVGSLAASQLKTALAKKLPLDVLSIDTGSELTSLRVEVGKYLTDTLYLGYVGQAGANPQRGENPHTVRLEWQLSKTMSLEGYAGTAPAAGGDLVWSHDY